MIQSPTQDAPRRPGSEMLLQAPRRFSLSETVLSHGWHQLTPFRWDGRAATLRTVERLSPGKVCLLAIRQPGGRGKFLRISALPPIPRDPDRNTLKSRVTRMLNLNLDLEAFYTLCRRDPVLRYVPRVGAGRFLRAGSVYEDVFKAICATNISWRQAVRAVNRIGDLGEPFGESDCRAFPSPEQILAAGPHKLSELSRLGYRVPYLLEWAERTLSGAPIWKAAEEGSLGRKELEDLFLSVRGVGRTTCRYLMMIRGLAEDIPIDSSVLLYLREARFGGRTPTPRQIDRLYGKFGAWKAYAYWFEFLPWARKHWDLAPDSTRR